MVGMMVMMMVEVVGECAPSLHVECLVYGNSTPEEARAIYQGLVDTLARECHTKYVLVKVPLVVEVFVVVMGVVMSQSKIVSLLYKSAERSALF